MAARRMQTGIQEALIAGLGVLLAATIPLLPPPLGMAAALAAGMLAGPVGVAASSIAAVASPGPHPLAALLGYSARRGPWGVAAALLAAGLAAVTAGASLAATNWKGALTVLTLAAVLAISAYGKPLEPARLPSLTPRRIIYLGGAVLAAAAAAVAYTAWGLPAGVIAAAALLYAAMSGPNHLVYAALALLLLEAWLEPQAVAALEASIETALD